MSCVRIPTEALGEQDHLLSFSDEGLEGQQGEGKRHGVRCALLAMVTLASSLAVASAFLLLHRSTGVAAGARVLTSASGVSIWEESASESSPAPLSRYAVAYVWSDPQVYYREHNWTIERQSYVGPYAHGRGVCGLALSAIASKQLLQESVGADGVADAVVLTDNMRDEHHGYLKDLGIRVLFTNLTDLYTFEKYDLNTSYHENHRAAFFKMRASIMKAGLAGLTEYHSIIYLDVDAFLHAPPPRPNPMPDDSVEFFSESCCDDAPLAVGSFALKPQQDAFEDMVRLIAVGFSPEAGWGTRGLRIGPGHWPTIECDWKKIAGPGNRYNVQAYCSDDNTPRWDFLGAEGDKGLSSSEYAKVGLPRCRGGQGFVVQRVRKGSRHVPAAAGGRISQSRSGVQLLRHVQTMDV